jgi:mannonate dehydratase
MAMGTFTGLAAAHGEGGGVELTPPSSEAGHAAVDDLAQATFDGLDARAVWDTHAHLLGTGDSGSGCRVHPAMQQWWHPEDWLRRRVILSAAGVAADAPAIDRAYVDRLRHLARGFPRGARWMLFAFDEAHDDAGHPRADWTTFHVPNDYAARIAAAHPQRFEWVASIHPYREDAVERLDAAAVAGARAVKWLPSAMNIDPRDPRCRPFYDRLARLGLPLIVHSGEEKAVPGAHREDFGNPLLMRVPLEHGVRVIVAHAASLGAAHDTDRPSAPKVAAFDLFARLMDEGAWRSLLLADISAVAQINRAPRVVRVLLRRDDWHPRLLHGSDHPLPGVKLLVSPARLAAAGLLDAGDVLPLVGLRERNPLLFDLALKRRLRDANGARFSRSVFETRPHFDRPTATLQRDPAAQRAPLPSARTTT